MVSFSRTALFSAVVALSSAGIAQAKLGESHRELGIRLPNPLSCQGGHIKEGTTTTAADNGYRKLGIRLVPQGTSTSNGSVGGSAGDSLDSGEGICWNNYQFGPDTTRGAFEFGLDTDGKPVLYDHRTEEDAIMVWKDDLATPGDKMVVSDSTLSVEKADGTVVWSVGGPGCGSGNGNGITKLVIDNAGTVELKKGGNNIFWSVDLTGTVSGGCVV